MKKYEDNEQRRVATRVTVYVLSMSCGKCQTGKMFTSGQAIDALTPHRCNTCGRKASYPGKGYPRTQTEMECF